MKYLSFSIQNFKGTPQADITFEHGPIVTLVGLNESGKTTLMQAIQTFQKYIKGNPPDIAHLNQMRPKGIDFSKDIKLSATLSLDSSDKTAIQRYWRKDMRKQVDLELGDTFGYHVVLKYLVSKYKDKAISVTFQVRRKGNSKSLHQSSRPDWLKIVNFMEDKLVPEVLYYDDFLFDVPNKIFFSKSGATKKPDEETENNKNWKSILEDILRAVKSNLSFQDHVVDEWAEDEELSRQRLAKMEEILDSVVTEQWKTLFGQKSVHFREIKLLPRYDVDRLEIEIKISSNDRTQFSVAERSKGFKWFFSYLLSTEFRKLRTKNILFLLDEPASNLHSSAQQKILRAIDRLKTEARVIYSTHSHHMIEPSWLGSAYICLNEDISEEVLEGGMNLSKKAEITYHRFFTYVGSGMGSDNMSFFQPILDKLEHVPSKLEAVPRVVICEGRNDWYGYNYFQNEILKTRKRLHFYPGGGKDKLYTVIALYLSWGKGFIVLLDGDDGVESKKAYVKYFGDVVKNRLFTLKDLVGKPVAFEGLISSGDQKRIVDSCFGSGSYETAKQKSTKSLKKALNLAIIQNLIMKKVPSGITSRSKSTFKKVFDVLKNKMPSD